MPPKRITKKEKETFFYDEPESPDVITPGELSKEEKDFINMLLKQHNVPLPEVKTKQPKNMGLVMKATSKITKEGKKRVLTTEMKTKTGLSQKEKDGIKTTLNQVLKEHLG